MSMQLLLMSGIFLLLLQSESVGQSLIITGRIRCQNQINQPSTRGAERLIIKLNNNPEKSTLTQSEPFQGIFEINTGIHPKQLYNKEVLISVLTNCKSCKEEGFFVNIWPEQVKQREITSNERYFDLGTKVIHELCDSLELPTFELAYQHLNAIRSFEKGKTYALQEYNAATVISPSIMNVFYNALQTLITIVGIPGPNPFPISSIRNGLFLSYSPTIISNNIGFNFAPLRDYSEAVFWNPSAMTFENKGNINAFTNYRNYIRSSGFIQIKEKIGFGTGFIYLAQKENVVNTKTKESAYYLSSSYKITDKLSLGISSKIIYQNIESPRTIIPYIVRVERMNKSDIDLAWIKRDTTFIKKTSFDSDISLLYAFKPSLIAGVNLMNIFGNPLISGANFPAKEQKQEAIRSIGAGIAYRWKRLNVGTDIFLSKNYSNVALGVNYIPYKKIQVTLGISSYKYTHTIGIRINKFRLTYLNNFDAITYQANDNEQQFFIANARLYSSFIWDF